MDTRKHVVAEAPPIAPLHPAPLLAWREESVRLSEEERVAGALSVAAHNGDASVRAYYRHLLAAAGTPPALIAAIEARAGDLPKRLAAIVHYAARFAEDSRSIRCADVRLLEAAGLSFGEIMALTRVVAVTVYETSLAGTFGTDGGSL